MTGALIVTEGKDDVRALREILLRQLGMKVSRYRSPVFSQDEQVLLNEQGDHQVILMAAGDHGRVAKRCHELLDEGKLVRHCDRLGVVFDPDKDDDSAWQDWIERKIIGDDWSVEQTTLGYRLSDEQAQGIDLVPVPWDAGSTFNELDERARCLERVAIGVLQEGSDEDADLVLQLLRVLQQQNRSVTWKTAFRLLNAIRKPETEDGFFDQVFGQDKELRAGVRPVLESTELWRRLSLLAGVG